MRSDEKPSTKQNGKKCARSNKIARSLPLSLSPYLSPSLSPSLSLFGQLESFRVGFGFALRFIRERALASNGRL